ncbi:MAG TPA: TIGR02530 family flagellar biosynthesis protein [Planctomycetota bacterium]|nr:TIGR02530 family flagellar biosynthesis protein [Planctomycetota bacterium]
MVHESQSLSHPVMPKTGLPTGGVTPTPSGGSFEQALSRQGVQGVRFSAHASERLAQRKIQLSEVDLDRISGATDKAAAKGSRESLFLLDNLGLIVNVKNRTVLTAIDPTRMREGIVTNIDSTVIIGKE